MLELLLLVLSDVCVLLVLWNVYGDCENYATLKGHSGAVMELHYNTDGRCVCLNYKIKNLLHHLHCQLKFLYCGCCVYYSCINASFCHILSVFVSSSLLFSASTDKTVCVWDSETGERVKRLKGHTSFVNSCFPARRGPQLACTGSDDGTVKVNSIQSRLETLKKALL